MATKKTSKPTATRGGQLTGVAPAASSTRSPTTWS